MNRPAPYGNSCPRTRRLSIAPAPPVVARGTRLLVEVGAEEIRGDCDAANTAMVMAFEREGYACLVNRPAGATEERARGAEHRGFHPAESRPKVRLGPPRP